MELDRLNTKVRDFRTQNTKHVKILTNKLKNRAKEEGEELVNLVNAELRCFLSTAEKLFITLNGVKKAIEVADNVPNPTNFAALVQANMKKPWLQQRYLDSVAYDSQENTESKVDNNFYDEDEERISDNEPVKTAAETKKARGTKKSKKKSSKKTKSNELHRIEGLVTETSREKIKKLAKARNITQKEVIGQILNAVLEATL